MAKMNNHHIGLHIEIAVDNCPENYVEEFTKDELDERIDNIAQGGQCSPTYLRLLYLYSATYDAIHTLSYGEVKRVVFTFPRWRYNGN